MFLWKNPSPIDMLFTTATMLLVKSYRRNNTYRRGFASRVASYARLTGREESGPAPVVEDGVALVVEEPGL
jgi:hypothetical protein